MLQQKPSPATGLQDTQLEHYYEYEMLPTDGRIVRYLILQPASTDTDPLVCTLHTAHLDEIPHFEALSYVCGIPVKNKQITCNGKAIRITANLHDALCQVRLTNTPRTLWADSICINQADPKEQGDQVSLMAHIYKKSNCTLICLGVSERVHALAVVDLVADIDDMIQDVFGRADFNWDLNSFPFPDEEEPLISHSGWESFGVMLQHPWFRRGWVVQEASLCHDALILWADTNIDWLKLVRAYLWYRFRALKLTNLQRIWLSDLHIQGFNVRRNREAITFRPKSGTKPFNLLEILDCARWLGVTDPRDRIYAFLSLPNSNRLLPTLRPNYEVPYLHVYRDLAYDYVRINEDLDILHFVHNDDSVLESDIASWIPRWNMHLYSSLISSHKYGRDSGGIISRSSSKTIASLDQTTLKVRALLMDTVAFAAQGFDKNSTTSTDVVSLWESVSTRSTKSPYSCSSLRAFITIFRCGVYRGRFKEWESLESAYMKLLQHELSQGDASYSNAQLFHKMRMEDVHNKSFIVTNRGYYGLAPSIVKEGDICCIIFGTCLPFILRRAHQDGHYKLVGSVLILSKEPDHNGYPCNLGGSEDYEDWAEWGLDEETICLC